MPYDPQSGTCSRRNSGKDVDESPAHGENLNLIDEGNEHIAKVDFRKAFSTLQEALRLNHKSDDALIDLAIVNMKLGNQAEAVRAFRKVLKLDPKMEHVLKQMPELTCDKGLEVLAKLGLKPKTS